MSVSLTHPIVHARDRHASPQFLVDLLGLEPPSAFGPFAVVQLGNGVSLDYADGSGPHPQHYAFLVSEDEFTEIYGRIRDRGMQHWADPRGSRPGEINNNDGGRGVYFQDPAGHYMEILTRPYGSGAG